MIHLRLGRPGAAEDESASRRPVTGCLPQVSAKMACAEQTFMLVATRSHRHSCSQRHSCILSTDDNEAQIDKEYTEEAHHDTLVPKCHIQTDTSHKIYQSQVLAAELVHLLPLRPSSLLSPLLGDQLSNIQVADAGVQIHVVGAHERRLLPHFVDHIEQDHDWCRKVSLEEALGDLAAAHVSPTDWPHTCPELSDQDQAVEDEAHP